MSDQGVALDRISDVLGHDGSRTTEQVYRHMIRPTIGDGKDVMTGVFGTRTAGDE